MFYFVVKRLGWIKSIPLAALLFDSLLKLYYFIHKPEMLDWVDQIEAEVSKWSGITLSLHRYGGTQFNHKSRELAHIHSNGLLDVRLSRAIKARLLLEGRIKDHHAFPHSGWISFQITTANDRLYALELIKMACRYSRTNNKSSF